MNILIKVYRTFNLDSLVMHRWLVIHYKGLLVKGSIHFILCSIYCSAVHTIRLILLFVVHYSCWYNCVIQFHYYFTIALGLYHFWTIFTSLFENKHHCCIVSGIMIGIICLLGLGLDYGLAL